MALRWSDLRLSRPFLLARGFGGAGMLDRRWHETFRTTAVFEERPPDSLRFVTVGRPWSSADRSIGSSEEAAAFSEPGWLKYGMDFHLTALPGGWTFVETSTLCEATDAGALRRFRAYWTLIGPFSGLIRRDVLATLGRPRPGRASAGLPVAPVPYVTTRPLDAGGHGQTPTALEVQK